MPTQPDRRWQVLIRPRPTLADPTTRTGLRNFWLHRPCGTGGRVFSLEGFCVARTATECAVG